MWRTRAVRRLLIEDVAGIRIPPPAEEGPEAEGEGEVGPSAEGPGEPPSSPLAEAEEALARARRRAAAVAVLDGIAILVLIFLGAAEGNPLNLGHTEQSIFTLAILGVAVHAGFRLGQLEKYNAVARASAELASRDPEAGD